MSARGESTSLTLLARLRAGEQQAWQRLVQLYGPFIHFWCTQFGVYGADAEDVLQEVLQAVAVGLPNFHKAQTGDTFRGWLRGITRNKLLDHRRRKVRQPPAPGGTEALIHLGQVSDPMPDETEDPQEQVTMLYHRALALVRVEFEERTWNAFWRAAVDGHPVEIIAIELGVSSAAIRKAKSRVLRRLREEVGDAIA